jgi:hypothetical protein
MLKWNPGDEWKLEYHLPGYYSKHEPSQLTKDQKSVFQEFVLKFETEFLKECGELENRKHIPSKLAEESRNRSIADETKSEMKIEKQAEKPMIVGKDKPNGKAEVSKSVKESSKSVGNKGLSAERPFISNVNCTRAVKDPSDAKQKGNTTQSKPKAQEDLHKFVTRAVKPLSKFRMKANCETQVRVKQPWRC